MARGMNHVYLIGALTRNPELRYTPSGTAIYEGTVAGEDLVIASNGNPRRVPWYHRFTVMGKQATYLADHSHVRGDRMIVEGSLEYSEWIPEGETKKRNRVSVRGLRVEHITGEHELVDEQGNLRAADGTNQVMLIGNVSRVPDRRVTPAGDTVTSLSIAVSEVFTDRQGVRQERVHWIEINAWRGLGEFAAALGKGTPVLISGRLVNESWTDKDGQKRSQTRVEANKVEALARGTARPADGQQDEYRDAAPQNARPIATRPAEPRPAVTRPAPAAAPAVTATLERPALARDAGRPAARARSVMDDLPPEEDLPF